MIRANIFFYEINHFVKNKYKVITYFIFVVACIYSIYAGFDLQKKQLNTITNIEQSQQESILQLIKWYKNGQIGPDDKSWVDIRDPRWALSYTQLYNIKKPSPLLPLGIGQSEQYGYYKQITSWSSTYDADMVEELSNPERLVNGNVDFMFLIIFLLPVLIIILTYNIGGLEKDYRFEKLISIQFGSVKKWVFYRFVFYIFVLILTVSCFILTVALINNAFNDKFFEIGALLSLSVLYILFFSFLFYSIVIVSDGSGAAAFNMITTWLLLCVIIPGSVHQFASISHPVNYMTDYLDANRKEAYEVFERPIGDLYDSLITIYPSLLMTAHSKDEIIDSQIIANSVCAIVNQNNQNAIDKIETQNELKNSLIKSSYWFNPVSFFQNKWNSLTETDYYSYKTYRQQVQQSIDKQIELLVLECWSKTEVNYSIYDTYLNKILDLE